MASVLGSKGRGRSPPFSVGILAVPENGSGWSVRCRRVQILLSLRVKEVASFVHEGVQDALVVFLAVVSIECDGNARQVARALYAI